MTKKPKMNMPQSTAGLIRYFDDSQESIKLKPQHVLAVCFIILFMVVAAKMLFVGV